MPPAALKKCVVAYATRHRQYLWAVDLPPQATIADALVAARAAAARTATGGGENPLAGIEEVPWDEAPVGVFGELRERSDVPQDGDRIELYRPLRSDPRQRRREAVQRSRKASR